MSVSTLTAQICVITIGSRDPDDCVRSAVANVALEGLRPSDEAIQLTRAVASGQMRAPDAVKQLRLRYVCHA